MLNSADFEKIIDKVISYDGGDKGDRYIEKFTKSSILSILEDPNQTTIIKQRYEELKVDHLNLDLFVRAFLDILTHKHDETLYLTMGLIDLFRDICATYNLPNSIKFTDITNYIVENYLNRSQRTHKIMTKQFPAQKKFQEKSELIREIDISPPIVYGNTTENIKRLLNSNVTSDRARRQGNNVKKTYFGKEVKKIFSLDNLASYINVFNVDCSLYKTICPKNSQDKKEVVILNISWSERQGRVGAVMKDYQISFWERNDNFEFEKTFSTVSDVLELQTNIWYIEFLNMWITSDKTNALYGWDIEKEKKQFEMKELRVSGNIIDLAALERMKLVIVATTDHFLTILDLKKKFVVSQMNISEGGIQSIFWFSTYQILLTVGWEKNIKLWSIDPASFDITKTGMLVGHDFIVSSVGAIESTPMVVSVDDAGILKTWDIRDMMPIQTTQLQLKGKITQFVDLLSVNKLGFAGKRVSYLEFDDLQQTKPEGEQGELYPLAVEYNADLKEFVICTKKDMRFLDLETGRVTKIYTSLLQSENNDITVFQLIDKSKRFILGDSKGNLTAHQYSTGDCLRKLVSHSNEITALKIDHKNHLIVSGGWDSVLNVQKEVKGTYELKKTVKNLHHNKVVSLVEISVYHNLLITSTQNNLLYIWDYEFARLIAVIQTTEASEFSCVHFVNGYSVLIITETNGKIHVLNFTRRESSFISFYRLASMSFEEGTFVTKILSHFDQEEDSTTSSKFYFATNQGDVKSFNTNSFFQLENLKKIPHANQKSNYNADRMANEDFLNALSNFEQVIININEIEPSNIQSLVSFTAEQIENHTCQTFHAHKSSLTTLSFFTLANKRIVTSSTDQFLKIWTLEGILQASVKISQPLPILWNLNTEKANIHQDKRKVLYAIKLIENIRKQYLKEMTPKEQESASIKEFFTKISGSEKRLHRAETDLALSSLVKKIPEFGEAAKIITMNDEYSARDLNFHKFRDLYKKELQGPSLKELDLIKRITAIQTQGLTNTKQRDQIRRNKNALENAAILEKKREKDKFLSFLLQENQNALKLQTDQNVRTLELNKKLSQIKQNEMYLLNLNDSEFPTSLNGSFARKSHPTNASRDFSPASSIKMKRNTSLLSPQNSIILTDNKFVEKPRFSNYSQDSIKLEGETVSNLELLLATSPSSKDHLSQINSYSTLNLNHRIKPNKSHTKIELVDYYRQKQNYSSLGTSILQTIGKSTSEERHSKKIDKNPLHFILGKLNQDVKQAQVKGYVKKNLSAFEIKTPSKSCEKIKTSLSFAKQEEFSRASLPTKKEGEKSEDFLRELRHIRQETHDSWKKILFKPDPNINRKFTVKGNVNLNINNVHVKNVLS